MSGAYNNASASSWINNCQTMEELQQSAIIKALRAVTGQFKVLADTTVNGSTALVTESEFSFPIKKGAKYILEMNLIISTGATPGIKVRLICPANTANTTFQGIATSTAAGTVAVVHLANNTHLNASIIATAAAYDSLSVQGLLIPSADDTLTVQFAQQVSDASDTILVRGSTMNLIQLSSSRRAPNVV